MDATAVAIPPHPHTHLLFFLFFLVFLPFAAEVWTWVARIETGIDGILLLTACSLSLRVRARVSLSMQR